MAVIIPIISEWNAKGVDRAMADIQKAGSGFDKFSAGISKASRTATIALAGISVAAVDFAKAAAQDEQAAAIFAKTLRNTTKATDAQVQATEDWIAKQGKLLGVTDDQLRPSLGKLVTATKDVTKAQELAALAMDISAARGLPLESVSQSLAKAYAGNFAALKKLVPGISEAAIASGDWATVQAELNNVVGGAAAESAGTAAGQFQIMTVQMDEAKEAIGAGLLPIFQEFLPYIQKMTDYIQNNTDQIIKIIKAVAGFAAVIKTLSAVVKTYTTIQSILNIVLTANPIGLIVVAIAALIAGFVLAYKKSDTFRNMVNSLFEILKTVANFIKNVMIAYFELWFTIIDKVKTAIKSVVDKLGPLKTFFGGSNTVTQNLNVNSSASSNQGNKSKPQMIVTDEIVARSISRILAKSDLRNGSTIGFA
jgi:hypothetical protein